MSKIVDVFIVVRDHNGIGESQILDAYLDRDKALEAVEALDKVLNPMFRGRVVRTKLEM